MMNLIFKRDPVWLECLQTPDVSANLLLLGGDGQQVVVPAPLLLAASTVVRSILTDHLPTAYSPCCLSLPAITGDVLQIFGDILATGAAVGAHQEDKIEEVRQVFEMLGVEARIVSSHIESIQVGQVLDRDITKESFTEVSGIGLDEENTCKLEINVKIESKENIGVKVKSEESESFEIGEPYKQNMTKKSSLIIQQSPSSTTSEKSGNLKNNVNLSEPKKRKKSPLSPILSHPTPKKAKQPTTCKSTAIPVRSQSLVSDVLRVAPITHQRTPRNPPTAFKASESNGDKPLTSKPKSPGSLKKRKYAKSNVPCNLCPLKFAHKGSLLSHVNFVHDEIEIPCQLCPQKFTQKDSLLLHVKTIHDKNLIPCNLCSQKFTQQSKMKMHMDSVHKKIVYPCKLCPQKFTLKNSLSRHVRSVHDKILVPCNLCTQKFTWQSKMKRHMDSVHKKIVYPCKLCPQKFTRRDSVLKHVKSIHEKNILASFAKKKSSLVSHVKSSHLKNLLKLYVDSVHKGLDSP